jgi:hypothetical protein
VVGILQLVLSVTLGWRAKSLRSAVLFAAVACVILSFIPILSSYTFTGEYPAKQIRHLLDALERWGAVKSDGEPLFDIIDVPLAVEIAYVFAIAVLFGAMLGTVGYGLKKMLARAPEATS